MTTTTRQALERLQATKTGVPGWVRQLVEQLERERDSARREVAVLSSALSGDGSSSFALGAASSQGRKPLPGDYTDQVSWSGQGPNGHKDRFELDLVDRGDALEVRCSSWHGVSLVPSASNVVLIRPGRTL